MIWVYLFFFVLAIYIGYKSVRLYKEVKKGGKEVLKEKVIIGTVVTIHLLFSVLNVFFALSIISGLYNHITKKKRGKDW